MLRISMVTARSAPRLSGGSLYQRRIAAGAGVAGATVRVHEIRSSHLDHQRLEAPQVLRRASDDADVIVIDSLIAAAVAERMDCAAVPVVGLVHQRIGGASWSERRFALDLRAYRDMAALIAAGPMVAAELDRFGLHDNEVVIPGTDPLPALDDPPVLRHGRSIAILCVANWLPSKGIAELLTACRELPTSMATVHLVGDPRATSRYGRVVARLARTPALRRRVVVHGALEPDAVAPLLAGADVFALPSSQETYGMAWAEALAAGLPVVGWDASNLPNLVTDGVEGILARPGNIGGLTAALATLATDPRLRRRLSAGARRRAATFPTWSETAGRFVDVLRERAGQSVAR